MKNRQLEIDEKYMQRALFLSKLAGGYAAPNPMVGAVVVYNDKIIGEGYHKVCGQAHAEVNAIASVKERELLPLSTIYVTLEPCSHHGKTPPCSQLIIDSKIRRVVIGCLDSFDKVNGRGIQMLKDAGIEVVVGVLEDECIDLNRRFFTFHRYKRPYIILKWAQTADGYLDNDRPDSEPMSWLTGGYCKRIVHKMRAMESAIMVGSATVRRDNPSLNIRDWSGINPIKVVIDRDLKLSRDFNIFSDSAPVLCYNGKEDNDANKKIDFSSTSFLEEILADLHSQNITSLIVEGGEKLLNLFLERGLYDEALVFVSPLALCNLKGGSNLSGVKAPLIPKGEIVENSIVDGVLIKKIKKCAIINK